MSRSRNSRRGTIPSRPCGRPCSHCYPQLGDKYAEQADTDAEADRAEFESHPHYPFLCDPAAEDGRAARDVVIEPLIVAYHSSDE